VSHDEYQLFIQQLRKDSAQLNKQYNAFEELKTTLAQLQSKADSDPDADRRLRQVNALQQDPAFAALCEQAQAKLSELNHQLGRVCRQIEQAETTQQQPSTPSLAAPQAASARVDSRKRTPRHFV